MVFANPEVVRRINEEFIPVALKAAMVNNPPGGIEGAIYSEISRSKPAPQGICTTNSDGKVLAWALSFDDDANILKFLDHVINRYQEYPDADEKFAAQRYMKFPSHRLPDVADNGHRISIPEQHTNGASCPASPKLAHGTLVGSIVGRALDDNGVPVADTRRQEHYMEARLEIRPSVQQQLVHIAERSGDEPFSLPEGFVQSIVRPTHLGQLDVNPLGTVPGSKNDIRQWSFRGQRTPSENTKITRVQIQGISSVKGGQNTVGKRMDGRQWEHHVTLDWYGFVDINVDDKTVTKLALLAAGDERLQWGSTGLRHTMENEAEHLMAGHFIDLECGVRYAITAGQINHAQP